MQSLPSPYAGSAACHMNRQRPVAELSDPRNSTISRSSQGQGLSRIGEAPTPHEPASMKKMSMAGEQHRHARFVGCRNHFFIAL